MSSRGGFGNNLIGDADTEKQEHIHAAHNYLGHISVHNQSYFISYFIQADISTIDEVKIHWKNPQGNFASAIKLWKDKQSVVLITSWASLWYSCWRLEGINAIQRRIKWGLPVEIKNVFSAIVLGIEELALILSEILVACVEDDF